jgi:hypothetical protein
LTGPNSSTCGAAYRADFRAVLPLADGVFYVLCTNVDNGGNIIVSAGIRRAWSNPCGSVLRRHRSLDFLR